MRGARESFGGCCNGNELKLAVLERHFPYGSMRTQGSQRFSVGSNGQSSRIARAQYRWLANIDALNGPGLDQPGNLSCAVGATDRNPGWFRGFQRDPLRA